MKNRHPQNTRQTFGRSIFCTALAMAVLGMTGCEDPQLLDQDTYYQDKGITLPNGEKYELDIAMITPFAGHINPERKDLYLYIADHKVYKNATDVSTADCSTGACAEIDDSNIRLEDNRLKLKVSDNHELTCEVYNERNTIPEELVKNFEEISSAEASDVQYAHCSYYLGGAVGLYQTWEALKRKDTNGNDITQIRVSSGDSFGTSADISARFDDIPTPIILNDIGLHVDTFGNHNFDQNLEYLNNLLSLTNTNDDAKEENRENNKYHYVASNLVNVPQNLSGISPRILIEVPPKETTTKKDEPIHNMRVAIVSALDMQAMETVYPGRFGSLAIGNYCTLIQTIEDAYNDGARAFFILGHLIVNNDSLKAVLNAISYFNNHDAYKYLFSKDDIQYYHDSIQNLNNPNCKKDCDKNCSACNNTDANNECIACKDNCTNRCEKKYEGDICASVLEIPQKLLQSKFQEHGLNITHVKDIDFTVEAQANIYKEIIQEMHQEIYQGIIGILGEGASEALAVSIKPVSTTDPDVLNQTVNCDELQSENHHISYMPFGCVEQNNSTFFSYIKDNNLFTSDQSSALSCLTDDTDKNHMKLFDSLGLECRQVDHNIFNPNTDESNNPHEHSILYIQFPSEGVSTAQVSVTIDRVKALPELNKYTYTSNIQQINYKTIASDFTPGHYIEQDYNYCETVLGKFSNTNENNSQNNNSQNNPCIQYLETRKSATNTATSINELKENEQTLLRDCFVLIEKNRPITSEMLQDSVDALNCVYLSTARFYCAETDDATGEDINGDFKDYNFYDFGQGNLWTQFKMDNVNTFNDHDERTRSIFKTNLAVDSMFNYYLTKDYIPPINADFAMTNAGDIKRVTELQNITYGKLIELAPYDSIIQNVNLTAFELVNIIDEVLSRCDGKYGGYPIFSGLALSTKLEDTTLDSGEIKRTQRVQEIWKVDKNGALIEPIFIKHKNNSASCDKNCVFGKYELNGDKLNTNCKSHFHFTNNSHTYEICKGNTLSFESYASSEYEFKSLQDSIKAWVKVDKNREPIKYNLLTSSYLIGGGDNYIFKDVLSEISSVKSLPDTLNTKDYIISYLNKDGVLTDISNNICAEHHHTSETQKTFDNLETDHALCRFLLNKHFYISNTSDNFSRYVSSQADDSNTNEPFDDTCNKLLYPTNDEN